MCQRNGWNYVGISDISNPDEDQYYQEDVIHYIQDLYPVWAERMIGETIKVNGQKDEDLSFFVGYFMVCYTFTERCILYYIVVRNILNLIMVIEYM